MHRVVTDSPRARIAVLAALLTLSHLARPHEGLPAGSGDVPPGRWQRADAALLGPAWDGLEARHGAGWTAYIDTATGAPSMILGPAIPAGLPVRADDEGIARARAFLVELRDVLRVDDPSAFELERAVAVPSPYGREVVYINFKQRHGGMDVWHQSPGGSREKLAMVKFCFKGRDLVMFGSDAVPGLRLPEAVVLDEGEATRRALNELGSLALAAESVSSRSYVSARGDGAFLAREVMVATRDGEPHDFTMIYDAHKGERVETRDDIRYADVTGSVKAGVLEYPGGPFTQEGLYDLRATVQQTGNWAYTTFPTGNFNIANAGTTPVTVTGRYLGRWAVVEDQSGNGNVSFSRTATPGTPLNIVLNPTNSAEFETAESSAYHWTTYTRHFINLFHPGFTGIADQRVNVNLNNACNAFFSNSNLSINFFRSNPHNTVPGVTCRNTAYQEIVAHEYGHAFHRWFHGSTNPGGFSEGIGDHIAYVMSHSRVVGRGWRSDGAVVRDYRPGMPANLTQWPGVGCFNEVHCIGQVYAGFTMDLEDNLIASMGGLAGALHFRYITLPMYASNPGDEVEALVGIYILDDNDTNWFNGTPRCREITSAARRHSLPVPWQLPASCGNEPLPPSPEYRAPVQVFTGATIPTDRAPSLDASQLNIWFTRYGPTLNPDVFTASRTSISAPWSTPVRVAEASSSSDERGVEVAGDGRTMFIATNRSGGAGGYDIWVSTRPSTTDPWSAPAPIPAINTSSNEWDPTLTADGLELLFASNRGASGRYEIWSASRSSPTSTDWTNVRRHRSGLGNYRPVAVSRDGLGLHYASDRDTPTLDLYQVFRWGPTYTFVAPAWRILSEANSGDHEEEGCLTADDFSFYFTRVQGTSGRSTIHRADRILPKMNGPAAARAGQNVRFTLRRDPGDYGYMALGIDPLPPTPVGGIQGTLLILPLVTVAAGAHNSMGVVQWTTAVVNAPGVFVQLQGITQDPAGQWYLSDRLSFLHLP